MTTVMIVCFAGIHTVEGYTNPIYSCSDESSSVIT